jgi:hypothetical protein
MGTIYTAKLLNILTIPLRKACEAGNRCRFLLLVFLCVACQGLESLEPVDRELKPEPESTPEPVQAHARENALPGAISIPVADGVGLTCRQRLSNLEWSDPSNELSRYHAGLPQTLLTTNIVPVAYLRKPKATMGPVAKKKLSALKREPRPTKAIRAFVERHVDDKALLREVFLREGYLFEDRPNLARALVLELTLSDLFEADTVYLYRGEVIQLERQGDEYVDENCDRAKLLLNDRVSLDPDALQEPLHIDLDELRRLTGAVRTLVRKVGERSAWIELVFPDATVRPALVELNGGQTAVSCIADERGDLSWTLLHAEEFWHWHQKLVGAAKMMVAERPAFDEPKDEADDVQEDGDLRLEWSRAYWANESSFWFRDVIYPVFDAQGNPTPPQVCIDFFFDTWERASGRWYQRRGRRPGRSQGDFDFSVYKELHRRQTLSVLAFAASEDAPLERFDIPRRHWVPFQRQAAFAKNMVRYSDQFREGDGLIIHGLREEDMEEHYHAVLILRTDPLTGMPMLVADNAGRPRLRSMSQAMMSAPKRSIKHRIRANRDKLLRR